MMGLLLRGAPSMLNVADNTGCTALSCASMMGHCTAVSYLLSAGANERALPAQGGVSSLAFAIHEGHDDVVRLLVDEGIEAVGGTSMMIRGAVYLLEAACVSRRATTLQILLALQRRLGVN